MEMVGPGDSEKLMETCGNIVIIHKIDSDTSRDSVSQIYQTFLYSDITDVSVMQPNALNHYSLQRRGNQSTSTSVHPRSQP